MTTINRMLIDTVRQAPDQEAYTYRDNGGRGEWTSMTYRAALDRISAIGGGLLDLGVTPHERVSILSNTRVEWALLDYAILGTGATTVPIYQTSSASETQYILDNCGAVTIIVEDAGQLEKLNRVRSSLPNLRHVIAIDMAGIDADDVIALADLEQRGAARRDDWHAASEKVTDDTLSSIIYTSGTTGPPKGCTLSHRNIFARLEAIAGAGTDLIGPGDRLVLFLPLAHTFAHDVCMAATRLRATVAFSTIATLMDDMAHVHPTVLPSVPRVFEKAYTRILGQFEEATGIKKSLIDWAMKVGRKRNHYVWVLGRRTPLLLAPQYAIAEKLVFSKIHARFGSQLRLCVSGGAPLSREVQEFFLACGIPILEGYGLTEGMPLTVNLPDGRFRPGSVGPALGDTELKIAEDGEILARSTMVFEGYYNNPEATSDTLQDGWLHTGDVGTIDRHGFLYITDRKKDLIITAGGKNISPQNIENALKATQYVSQAFAFGDRKPYVTALITLDEIELEGLAAARGLSGDLRELVATDAVRQVVAEAVSRANSQLGKVEQVKRYRILPIDFTVESGELTPSLKLKRKVVVERYGRWIEEMYGDGAPDADAITDAEVIEIQQAGAQAESAARPTPA